MKKIILSLFLSFFIFWNTFAEKNYFSYIDNFLENTKNKENLEKISEKIPYLIEKQQNKKILEILKYLKIQTKIRLKFLEKEENLQKILNSKKSFSNEKIKNFEDFFNKNFSNLQKWEIEIFSENKNFSWNLKYFLQNDEVLIIFQNKKIKINKKDFLNFFKINNNFSFEKIFFEIYEIKNEKYFLKPSFELCKNINKNCNEKNFEKFLTNFNDFFEVFFIINNEKKEFFINFFDKYLEISSKIIFSENEIQKIEIKWINFFRETQNFYIFYEKIENSIILKIFAKEKNLFDAKIILKEKKVFENKDDFFNENPEFKDIFQEENFDEKIFFENYKIKF